MKSHSMYRNKLARRWQVLFPGVLRANRIAAVPKGMQNMGATCFMSVVLQTMLHCPLVKGYFLSGAHVSKYCRRSSCMSCALDRMYLDVGVTERKTWLIGVSSIMDDRQRHTALLRFLNSCGCRQRILLGMPSKTHTSFSRVYWTRCIRACRNATATPVSIVAAAAVDALCIVCFSAACAVPIRAMRVATLGVSSSR